VIVPARHTVSLLVLNYNGIQHLRESLGSAVRAAARVTPAVPVVLVDNCSTDGSVDFARREFPQVEIVIAPWNDFLFSLNAVARRRQEDILIVLNNDMRFDEDFIAPLVAHFDDPDVFAAGAAILTWDGSADTIGPRCAHLRRCWFYKWWSDQCRAPALTLDVCGGAAAFRRSMFNELGGFDPMYRPGYYEDLDLSYRAWGRGWKTVYEPRSRVFHKESATMLARYGDAGKARILYRNHLLFTLKNIGGPSFLAGFFLLLPYRVLSPLLAGHVVPLMGFLQAVPLMPRALLARATSGAPVDLSRFEKVVTLHGKAAEAGG
jgi:GT2 family glycosyltransferase